MIVIGLTGRAGAGKDTVADRLVAKHGFTKMSFAGPLKDILLSVNPILGFHPMHPGTLITLSEALTDCGGEDGVKKLFPKYRSYAQKLGTEGVRKYDPDFWINTAIKEVVKLPRDARVVFTDVRFPNEAATIQRFFGRDYTTELWFVDRPESGLRSVTAHASEEHAGAMNEQVTVHNNGSVWDLEWIVDSLARDLVSVERVKLAA